MFKASIPKCRSARSPDNGMQVVWAMFMRLLLFLAVLAMGSIHYADSIVEVEPEVQDTPRSAPKKSKAKASDIINSFESNTTEGWQPRIGHESVSVTQADRYSGSYSLLTTGRQAEYSGCKINVSSAMSTGSEYRVAMWARLAPGSSPTTLKISLERKVGNNITYHPVVWSPVTAQGWTRLSTVYEYELPHDSLWLYVESTEGTSSFYIDDFALEYLPPPQVQTDIPSLKSHLAPNFKIGAAIWQGDITGAHAQLLKKHFNSITAEDAMKWGPIHPTEETYDFGPADALVDFAKANGMEVRGHALVWHKQVPDWLFLDAAGAPMTPTPQNKALLLQRLETHIRAVVTHFGDSVQAWDVANEVIDHTRPDGLRRNKWYEICGREYIDRAFIVARDAAPHAKLYINDYQTTLPAKRAALLNLVQDLKSRSIPIDGVGHQMHSDISWPSGADVVQTIDMFSAIPGIDNQITELDISIYDNDHDAYDVIPPSVLLKQGYRYRELFDAFRQLQGKISSVTFWGKADDHTWLSYYPITRLQAPLLFDDRLQAKPAFWGIVDPEKLKIEISGRVISDTGQGIRSAAVTLTDASGSRRTAITNALGFYSFSGVAPFENYFLVAAAKRYRFIARQLTPSSDLSDIDLVGVE